MPSDALPDYESIIDAFATAMFDRQLERFHGCFGRIPEGDDPVFFQPQREEPEPMSPQEILAHVTGDALSSELLEFETVEAARSFAILVLLRLGLSAVEAEDARSRSGLFAVH